MNYELIYILLPKFSEKEAEKKAEEIEKIVQDKAEKIVREDFWGKKKLAYPIRQFVHGYYVLIEFLADPEKIKEIDKELRPREDIVRFLITKIDEKMKAAREAVVKRKAEREKEERVKEAEKPEEKEERKEKEEEIAKEIKDKGKAQLKDLDKKIEEILDEDIT